ncbi:hypothetical protein [Bradyrhizobium elkanii]|uniref:hypothetical protein n=1 Tax=Bradyrhizobium elkanii TaxID=29448 RepID=UPI00272C181E|nr:hypothetical protein [Bradyrhizobium elkanii]WLA80292.1 hypothetical protein QNJ99_33640 [Bradyrhizobium elkanii]
MALVVTTWLWGNAYSELDVEKLYRGVKRNLTQPFRFICFTDADRKFSEEIEQFPIKDLELTKIKGCFARLRLFDPEWQAELGIQEETKILNLDLDLIVTGSISELFDKPDYFTILQGVNSANPCPYNGSVWLLRAGYKKHVWTSFSVDAAAEAPFYEFPDDQGWFWWTMPDAGAFRAGDGVYAFQKVGWPKGLALPSNARIVGFPGWRSPSKFTHLSWVQQHWV